MPYGMCPSCGTCCHYNLGSRKVWDEKYGDMQIAPKLCISCFVPIARGSGVEIRPGVSRNGHDLSGATGEVRWVDASDEGSLFWVSLSGAAVACFIRSELAPDWDHPSNKTPASGPGEGEPAEPGAAPDTAV